MGRAFLSATSCVLPPWSLDTLRFFPKIAGLASSFELALVRESIVSDKPFVTRDDIIAGLRSLGISAPVEVHSSLSAFGHVEGGAEAVVDALLAVFPLVLAPTFTYDTPASTPPSVHIALNGVQDDVQTLSTPAFTIDMPASRPLGIVPETLRKRPWAVRSVHPIMSFAAAGEGARELLALQTFDNPLAPVEHLLESLGGWILMLGTDFTSCTPIHLAEFRSGRRPFVRWCLDSEGRRFEVRVSGCSRGFAKLEPFAAPIAREIRIGNARVRAYPGPEFLQLAQAAIEADPEITICADRCRRCMDAFAGGPRL